MNFTIKHVHRNAMMLVDGEILSSYIFVGDIKWRICQSLLPIGTPFGVAA